MDAFAGLSEDHKQLVVKFLKFSRGKRDIAVQALQGEFDDLKSDRLHEDMYTQSDVEEMVEELCRVVKADMRQEVSTLINITSLLIKQLLEAADEQGAQLTFDTSSVEDRAVLENIENMRLDGPGQAGASRPNRLISIKDEHARLMEKNNELEESNRTLQERFAKLQGECSTMLGDNSVLRRELRSLKEQMALAADEKRAAAGAKAEFDSKRGAEESEDVEELRRELEKTKHMLAEAEDETAKKLSDSKQFVQLKKLLSTKSEQVVSLRRRLMEYEPDTGDTKHDDM